MQKFIIYAPKKAILFPKNAELPSKVVCKEVSVGGKDLKVVEDSLANFYLLKGLLPELSCPIYRYYDFPNVENDPKKPAMQHQKDGAAFHVEHKKSFNVSEMGSGKTVTVIYAADYLLQEKKIKHVLIYSPLSTLNRVWSDTLFDTFLHRGYRNVVLHSKSPQKRKELAQMDAEFYIANHDFIGVSTKKITDKHGNETFEILPEYKQLYDKIDLILFDESACLRNGENYMYKAFRSLIRPKQRLVLMTGTPTPTQATDTFWPSKLVNPDATPKYFGAYRKQVMYSIKIGPFDKWVNREGVEDIVFNSMQPVFRVKKSDVIDLPPVTFEKREVELTKQQKDSFKTMIREMTMTVGDKTIDAVNAAARVIKAHQILCGSVKDGDEYVELDCQPRLKVVEECIEASLSKTIVIVPFKGIARYLHSELSKKYGCEIVNGDVSSSERDEIFKRFKEDKSLRVIICHPRVMAHGLTLITASTMVFYSAIRGNEIYRQVLERMNRPGQKLDMTVVQIGGHDLEWKMYEALDDKEEFQQNVLALYEEMLKNA